MKKLFLLLAGLAVMVACNDPKSDPKPEPDPDPKPTEKPVLEKDAISMKSNQVAQLKVLNYTGDVTWSVENEDIVLVTDKGEVVSFMIGETNVLATLADKTVLKCKATVEKTADKCVFNLPLLEWGATEEQLTETETREFDSTEPLKDGSGVSMLFFEANPATEYMQLYSYMVDNADGMYEVEVIVPSDKEADVNTYYATFSERNYYIGVVDNLSVFVDSRENPTHSVLAGLFYLTQDQSMMGLVCRHVEQTNWNSAPSFIPANEMDRHMMSISPEKFFNKTIRVR